MGLRRRRRADEDDPSSRNVLALILVAALMNTGWDLASPFVPLFVLELEPGDPRSAALWSGLMVGISPFLSAVSGPFWGVVADRFGARAVLMRTMVVSAVLVAALAAVSTIWELLLVRILIGFFGGFIVLSQALAVQGGGRERAGQMIGVLQAVSLVCMAIVPPLAGLSIDRWGLRSNFLLAATIMVPASVVLWRLYRPLAVPAERAESQATRRSSRPRWTVLLEPRLAIATVVVFWALYVERTFNALMPLLVVELLPDSDQVGFLSGLALGLGSGATALAAVVCGRLSRRIPSRTLLIGSLAFGCLLLPLLAWAGTVWQLLALRVLQGLLAGGAVTLGYAYISQLVPADRLTVTFSIVASCSMIGGAIGPMSLGVLAAFSLRLPLLIGAVAFGICLLLLLQIPRWSGAPRHVRQPAPRPRDGGA